MGLWQRLFGPRERPEETLRLTRRAMDLLAEGKTDDEVQRALFREGVSVERAASLVAEVRRVQRMVRGPVIVLLLGLGMLGVPARPCAAQQPADSAARPPADTARRTAADTARQAAADTARASVGPDTTRRSPGDTAVAPASPPPAQTIVMPADTTLAAACQGVRSGGVAANLLVVVFRPEAPEKELAAVAKAVGGTLLGTVPGGDGSAYYVRVPAEGDDHRLAAAADQVIRYQPVQQVGPTVCPSVAVAPPPPPADTTKRPSP
jgi:hypothetical protein